MEQKPDTTNVLYLDEFRREKWLTNLRRAREIGQVLLFNQENATDAQVLSFPVRVEGEPDGAA